MEQIQPEKSNLIVLAEWAEQCERFEEGYQFMQQHISKNPVLSQKERSIFLTSFTCVIGEKRTSLRMIKSISQKQANQPFIHLIKKQEQAIYNELKSKCQEMLDTIDTKLIPHADDHSKAQYYHTKGNIYGKLAEFSEGDQKLKYKDKASQTIMLAQNHIISKLKPTDPIRLGTVLSQSVWLYDMLDRPQEAIEMAKTAFDEAIEHIEDIPESQYKDATSIMQLLRDNLTLWTQDIYDNNNNNQNQIPSA